MIRDLQMMKDISPLFDKKLVIWGIGKKGRQILTDILEMGAGKKGIFVCDSDCSLQGREILNNIVLSPKNLYSEIEDVAKEDIAVLVTVVSTRAQNEIINELERVLGKTIEIFTSNAIEWGIYFGLKNPNIEREYRDKKILEHEKKMLQRKDDMEQMERTFKYFAFLPLHNDEIILIYQPAKVASSTVYKSISNYGRYALHCHMLDNIGEDGDSLRKLLELKSGKIICLVRDPVGRQIAAMWQNIHQVYRYSVEADFAEIEAYFFPEHFVGGEFGWFDRELKKVFNIDVFEYPFDQEKGYSIIQKGNIEVLLMKMEKLNDLEAVIGEFLSIENFKLDNQNVGSEKPYRFAYRDYKANFKLPKEVLDNVYVKNEHTKHFYSEQERGIFYNKWLKDKLYKEYV